MSMSMIWAALLLASAPASARAEGSGPQVTRVLCRLGFTPVKMTPLRSGHHVVDVSVNGRPATFVVDTGAGASILHAPLAAEFGLTPAGGPAVAAAGAGGALSAAALTPAPLGIAGNDLGQVRLFASDLTGVVAALKQVSGRDVQGIIGQDQLRARHGIVDVRQSMLYLQGGNRAGC